MGQFRPIWVSTAARFKPKIAKMASSFIPVEKDIANTTTQPTETEEGKVDVAATHIVI